MVSKAELEGTGVSKRGLLMTGLRLSQAVGPDAGRASELAMEYITALTLLRPDLIAAAKKQDEKAATATKKKFKPHPGPQEKAFNTPIDKPIIPGRGF